MEAAEGAEPEGWLRPSLLRLLPYEAYFSAVESVMTALGGRPHWGKLHTRTAAQPASSYPEFGASSPSATGSTPRAGS